MRITLVFVWLAAAFGTQGSSSAQPMLRAGAAKVDVTPLENELPQSFEGVLDRIYSRAIVIDDGTSTAALISVDAGAVPDAIWQDVTERLERELGIPTDNVVLTATHTHSVPRQGVGAYTDKIVESVRLAKARLTSARVGYGTGVSYLNVNRNIIDPRTRRWWEGPNYEGPSDKTVAVIVFQDLRGEPIAVYYNYAMHAVTVGQLDLVSGDAPGTASKYVEDNFDGSVVALWSSGAAGDQNPRYFQQTYDLREIRIKDYAERGIDISNAMPPGGEGLDQTGSRGREADEPAEANDPVDGPVPRAKKCCTSCAVWTECRPTSGSRDATRSSAARGASARTRDAPAFPESIARRHPSRFASGCSRSATS